MRIPKRFEPMVKKAWEDEDGFWIVLESEFQTQWDEGRTIHAETKSKAIEELRQCTERERT